MGSPYNPYTNTLDIPDPFNARSLEGPTQSQSARRWSPTDLLLQYSYDPLDRRAFNLSQAGLGESGEEEDDKMVGLAPAIAFGAGALLDYFTNRGARNQLEEDRIANQRRFELMFAEDRERYETALRIDEEIRAEELQRYEWDKSREGGDWATNLSLRSPYWAWSRAIGANTMQTDAPPFQPSYTAEASDIADQPNPYGPYRYPGPRSA